MALNLRGAILKPQTPPFITESMTIASAGTAQEKEVKLPISLQQMAIGNPRNPKYLAIKLKKLVVEVISFPGDTDGDELTVTVTPTTQPSAAHPDITDRELMLKYKEVFKEPTNPGTNNYREYTIKSIPFFPGAIAVTPSIYIQVTHEVAEKVSFRLYYEWVQLDSKAFTQNVLGQGIINV